MLRRLAGYAVLIIGCQCLRADEPQAIPVTELGSKYELIGKLHSPLGNYISVEGVVVDGPSKGLEGGPNLRAQRIQGRATQEDIQICIRPYFYKWGEGKPASQVGDVADGDRGARLPKLEMGSSYRMDGYEIGRYVGTPAAAYEKAGVALQSPGFYFQTTFTVVRAKAIDPIKSAPADFLGRKALLEGTAHSIGDRAVMTSDDWTVIVNATDAWPDDVEGKTIETYGMYNPTDDRSTFSLVDGTWRLVRLEDQIGRSVELRGRARSHNSDWWFRYRDTDLYVENMTDLPGWTSENH